ncbi:MAG: hypothetical protein WEA76_05900 [Acidimicrobiia bacterium]
MSDDTLVRVAVVFGVGVIAVLWAVAARRGFAVRRHPISLPDLGPGVVLFTSSTCASCARMAERMVDIGDVTEVSYENSGASFPTEVRGVPAVALVDAEGRGWIAYGLVGVSRLQRWIAGGP